MNKGELSTREILLEFGFRPDRSVISNINPGLILHLGVFKLSASWVINRYFVDVVLLSGNYNTGRKIGMVNIQMPLQMTSREQCAAWLVWGLNKNSKHLIAESPVQYEWFELGKANENKLPWVIDQAAYNARPQCTVERRWLRLALNTLSESLEKMISDEYVIFSFQNKIFSIQCDDQVIPTPGSGECWPEDFHVKAANLKNLPKRLMSDPVMIDSWKGNLGIANWRYPLRKEHIVEDTKKTPPEIVPEHDS